MLTVEQIDKAPKDRLREEALWLHQEVTRLRREAAEQVTWERERTMSRWTKQATNPDAGVRWMSPTNRLLDAGEDPSLGLLHVHDPAVPPYLAKPATKRGRYQSGDIREAGPGSYIGKTLCGMPMMADELWCSARRTLQHAVNHNSSGLCRCVELCGMCSYLSACPTVEAAWEAS